jgi:transcriptional antiterminator RfaH
MHSTFGVTHLVLAGQEPVPVPDRIIDEIRAREGVDGLVRLGLPAGLRPGSTVRLIDGIFADAKGMLERLADDHRVAILLELLGREVRVYVPAASIATL